MPRKSNKSKQPAKSRLDSLARDLNRTLLHGARAQNTSGVWLPSTVATGQQIAIDVPPDPTGTMNFQFAIGDNSRQVQVSNRDATGAVSAMSWVAQPNSPEFSKYLTLQPDLTVPTWVFSQREFSLPDKPVPEEIAVFDSPIKGVKSTVLKWPASVLREFQTPDPAQYPENSNLPETCDISLWTRNKDSQDANLFSIDKWRPAILLRFGLKPPATTPVSSHGNDSSSVFELVGVPQGDRWYLDRLGLLSGTRGPANVTGVEYLLEDDGNALQPVDIFIARTNLTTVARPGQELAIRSQSSPPFVANSEADPTYDCLRLLEMASITNSGGYYVSITPSANAARKKASLKKTLVVCIYLEANLSELKGSIKVQAAANAVAYDLDINTTAPSIARFEEIEHINIVPFAPPGCVAFGWTRQIPDSIATDEDKFGYGTINLVEYQAEDASQKVLADSNNVIAISPLKQQFGDTYYKPARWHQTGHFQPPGAQREVAATRLLTPYQMRAFVALGRYATRDVDPTSHRYVAKLPCYQSNESPYAPLSTPSRRLITVSPGFRDIYGNRFPAISKDTQKQLFYTDALIPTSEWPGFRFSLYSSVNAGAPALFLEIAYTPRAASVDKDSRLIRLKQIRQQIEGAASEVSIDLIATPLIDAEFSLAVEICGALDTVITLEESTPPGTAGQKPIIPAVPIPLSPNSTVSALQPFAPKLVIRRKDFLPQTDDLPNIPPQLAAIILGQISTSINGVVLSAGPSPSLRGNDDNRMDEFQEVAKSFSQNLSGTFAIQIGFLRDRFNHHELWFIPNSLFPQAKTQDPWSYATARPLRTMLGSSPDDGFLVPDFSKAPTDQNGWHGYPLIQQKALDIDFDDLGRVAFALIEREAMKPQVLADQANMDLAEKLLTNKDNIARTLANWDQNPGDNSYLVPLFDKQSSDLQPTSIVNLVSDAFLRNLNSYYTVDTIVQLPLVWTARLRAQRSYSIETFYGQVSNPFELTRRRNDPSNRQPSFSDFVLSNQDKKLTLLYSVPPGTNDPNDDKEVPKVGNLNAIISHIQLSDTQPGSRDSQTVLNQGSWLELVSPSDANVTNPANLHWNGLQFPVPVAIRKFPAKPVIKSSQVSQATIPSAATSNVPQLTASNVPLLTRWGWQVSFAGQSLLQTDVIHIMVQYNQMDSDPLESAFIRTGAVWSPTSLLHCLVAFKSVSDNSLSNNWIVLPPKERLAILSELFDNLHTFLNPTLTVRTKAQDDLSPPDLFAVALVPAPPTILNDQLANPIMKGVTITPQTDAGTNQFESAILTADAIDINNLNNAFLVGGGVIRPVWNFRPGLVLKRNEKIPHYPDPCDSSLIYQCAEVQSPKVIWARNSWMGTIAYQADPNQTLQDALLAFFTALFNGADIQSYRVEVSSALVCQKGQLQLKNDYSLIPTDLMPGPNLDNQQTGVQILAGRVFDACQTLLGGDGGNVIAPPEMESSVLRLHIKISLEITTPEGIKTARTLVEIAAIDFPLPKQARTQSHRRIKSRREAKRLPKK